MLRGTSNSSVAVQLLLTMILWGGNNVAVKYQIRHWPPIFTVSTRFLLAGMVLMAVMRWTSWLGRPAELTATERGALWWRGGLTLAVYIVLFVSALQFTTSSTVALFMGTSPVWALIWEEHARRRRNPPGLLSKSELGAARALRAKRYIAALLALMGVLVLFMPGLKLEAMDWKGNLLALGASIMWTAFGRQCQGFGSRISGIELTGKTFWRAGLMLAPLALAEMIWIGVRWHPTSAWLQVYSVVFSGLLAFGLWNHALQVWPASRVFLFGNLIPITTLFFAWMFLGEQIRGEFWVALALILTGVIVGRRT